MELKSGIYQIKNTINGKVYVGSTIDFERRKYEHFKALKNNNHGNPKLQNAFKLLNDFITRINTIYNEDFQIIMLEHASPSYWEDINLENFHLVEEFRDGNALIPEEAFQ